VTAKKLIEPRQNELLAIRGPGSPEYVALRQELEGGFSRAKSLQSQHHEWRNRLRDEMAELRERAVTRGLTKRLREIELEFLDAAGTTQLVGDDLSTIARKLEESLSHAFVTTVKQIADGIEQARVTIAAESGLPLTAVVREGDPEVRPAPPLRTERTKGFMSKIGDWAAHFRRQLVGTTTIGALVGGVLGGVAGFFAGGVGAIPGFLAGMQAGTGWGLTLGAGSGIFSANKRLKEDTMRKSRDTLKEQLLPYLRTVSTECSEMCTDLINEMKQALSREFDLRIKDILLDIANQQQSIERGLALQKDRMQARSEVLVSELRLLEAPAHRARVALAQFKGAADG